MAKRNKEKNPIDNVKWYTGVEQWTFPLTKEQLDLIGRNPPDSDTMVEIIAVAPLSGNCAPDLILPIPISEGDLRDQLVDGYDAEPFLIRFGEMSAKDIESLREHDGW